MTDPVGMWGRLPTVREAETATLLGFKAEGCSASSQRHVFDMTAPRAGDLSKLGAFVLGLHGFGRDKVPEHMCKIANLRTGDARLVPANALASIGSLP